MQPILRHLDPPRMHRVSEKHTNVALQPLRLQCSNVTQNPNNCAKRANTNSQKTSTRVNRANVRKRLLRPTPALVSGDSIFATLRIPAILNRSHHQGDRPISAVLRNKTNLVACEAEIQNYCSASRLTTFTTHLFGQYPHIPPLFAKNTYNAVSCSPSFS